MQELEKGKNTEEGDCEGDSLEVIFTKFLLWLIFLSDLFQVLLKERCVCTCERDGQTEGWLGVLNLGSFFMHMFPQLCSKPSPGPLLGP